MPLAFPVYHRYLKGTPRNSKTLSPKLTIALATLLAIVGIMHVAELPGLLRSHNNVWDVVFQVGIAALWLAMSVRYVRRATRKQPPTLA